MSQDQIPESDRKQQEEGAVLTTRTDPGRIRPMTSSVTQLQTSESRKQEGKFGSPGFNSNEKFPTLDSHNRAISAKSSKPTEHSKTGESRKTSSKPSQSARYYDPPATKNQNFVLQNNKIMLSPNATDFTRLKPKNIMQDKERLYEETLQLKQLVNMLREENLKQKTKINNLEKEASKFEKMIQEANAASYKESTSTNKTTEPGHLTITLKQNVKELKGEMSKKDNELLEIKKSMKYTKIQELEAQMKAFQDEAVRMKTVMDHVMQQKTHVVLSDEDKNRLQEDYFVQATQLKTLKRDNEEMATAVKILEEQNFEYEKKITEQEKKYKREQNLHKKALQEKDKEIMRLRVEGGATGPITGVLNQTNSAKKPVNSLNRDDALRQELEKKTLENNNFLNQLAEKRNQVLNLERQLRDLRAEYNEKMTSTQNEKQALLRELDKLRNAKAGGMGDNSKEQPITSLRVQELKLDDYARRASFQRGFPADDKDSPRTYNATTGQTSSAFKDKDQQKGGPKKRVQKVRPEDMKDVGRELNMRLRIKRLTFADIEKSIWPEKVRKTGSVSVKEMIEVLKNEPFNMTNEEETVLTARFLIEENEHEYLYYDDNARNDLHIVKSILKKVIGTLPNWDEHKMKHLHEEIAEICVANYGGLKENLKVLCKSGYLTAEDLKKACNVIEVTLSDEQIEYIMTKLFEHSDNIHKLSIDRLFEVFTLKPKEMPEPGNNIKSLSDTSSKNKKVEQEEEEDGEEYEEEEQEEEGENEEGQTRKGGRISERSGEEEETNS